MPISVLCSCGKTLKVDEKHRGKKAKCPACGNPVLIEESEESTAVQASEPRRKSNADPDGDQDDAPEDREPIKRKKKKGAKGGSNMTLYAVGGCAVLLLLVCCMGGVGGGAYYFFFSGPPDDLVFVHDGAAGFVSIRVADGWKSAAIQDQVKKLSEKEKKAMDDKLKEMENDAGLRIDDMERVTMIVRSMDFKKEMPEFGVVLKTIKAMDRKKVIDGMNKDRKEKLKEVSHEGGTIYVGGGKGAGRDSGAFYFVSDRILLMAEKEDGIKDLLRRSKTPTKHPALLRGIQMSSSAKHHLVAAFEVSKRATDNLPAEAWKQAPNMKEATGVIFAGTLATDLALEAVITFPDSAKAEKGKKDVDELKATANQFIKAGGKNTPKALTKFMDSVTIEQRSAEVVMKGKLELDMKDMGIFNPFGGFGGGPIGGGPIGGGPGRMSVTQLQSANNLKQIGLAIHSFHEAKRSLPNHAILDNTGKELLSWRVALLPYVGEQALFAQIRTNEPWDSKHNRQYWNRMPTLYQLPGSGMQDRTYYQVFVGSETGFPKRKTPPYSDLSGIAITGLTDGSTNTIAVAEAASPVEWMRPDDIPFQMNNPSMNSRVGNHWGDNTFMAVMFDGAHHRFRRNMAFTSLQALITRAGGEPNNWNEVEEP